MAYTDKSLSEEENNSLNSLWIAVLQILEDEKKGLTERKILDQETTEWYSRKALETHLSNNPEEL